MALNYRKGFVHTLEAIIASTLVLGIVLTVIPEFQQEANTKPQEQVYSGLKALDNTGELTDNISAAEIESEIDPYVPQAYNHSVSIVKVNSVSDSISPPYQRYIDTTGNRSELQLWIKSANGLNISFNDKTLLEDYSEDGYKTAPVSSSKGWLNVTGSGELEYFFNSYVSYTSEIDQKHISVINYIVIKNGAKEIKVRIWE